MRWPSKFVRIALACALLAVGLTTPLVAQGEGGFVPAGPDDIVREQLPATPFVFAAYAAVWVVLIVYVFTLWTRINRVERELSEVSARLQAK
jgi:CcmD family protein